MLSLNMFEASSSGLDDVYCTSAVKHIHIPNTELDWVRLVVQKLTLSLLHLLKQNMLYELYLLV